MTVPVLLDDDEVSTQEDRWLEALRQFETEVPFWYYHARRLKLTMCRGWCQTAAVDGVHLFWNPEFTAKQSDQRLLFLLYHETFHVVAGHIWRGERYYQGMTGKELATVLRVWGHAIDHAIHQVSVPLIDSGHYPNMEFIPSGLYNVKFTGMSAEQIYEILKDEPEDEKFGEGKPGDLDVHILRGEGQAPAGSIEGKDGSWVLICDEQGNPLQPDENDPAPEPMRLGSLQRQIRDETCREDARTITPSGNVSKHSWRDALQRFVVGHAGNDYSYSRPNRNYLAQGIVVPGLYSPRISIKFAIDFSGSMDTEKLSQCAAEIEAARQQIGDHELELIPCDDDIPKDKNGLERTQTVVNGEPLTWSLPSGGGTDFRPVFEYLARKGERVTCLVYFTDCQGDYPSELPPYPVLWARCASGGRRKPPWGEIINL